MRFLKVVGFSAVSVLGLVCIVWPTGSLGVPIIDVVIIPCAGILMAIGGLVGATYTLSSK